MKYLNINSFDYVIHFIERIIMALKGLLYEINSEDAWKLDIQILNNYGSFRI